MKEKKPVRKYNALTRLRQYLGYYTHRAALVPVICLLMAVIAITFVAGVAGGIITIIYFILLLTAGIEVLPGLLIMAAGSVLFGLISWGASRVLQTYFRESEQGGLLNPKPPSDNPVLPDSDLLVRASGRNPQTQRQELLRPAQEAETPSDELLRPVE